MAKDCGPGGKGGAPGKKYPTAAMAKAIKAPRRPKVPVDSMDPEEEARQRGGYSKAHGMGTG